MILKTWSVFLFCLFVCSSHSRNFHSYEDVSNWRWVLQILTSARYSWPLSRKGSLPCHSYCNTGHPFIMVISVTLTLIAERLAVELSLPVLTTCVCRSWDYPTFRLRATARSVFSWISIEVHGLQINRLIDWRWSVWRADGWAASTIRLNFWWKFSFLTITQMFLNGID